MTTLFSSKKITFLPFPYFATSFIAPNVIQGETKEIICYLEAIDPFQALGYDLEQSISDPIIIEIINTNNPPTLNAVAGSNYFIIEDDAHSHSPK